MIEQVEVTNFQSLHSINIKLDRFTVIVGPSSSGKSAFTRALKTLTGNARGDAFISHGENQTIIKARTDRGTVALSRGKKNEYVLIPKNSEDGAQKTFTKLNGAVPEEVSEFLGIPAKEALNYADQFDMPYLLKTSAAEVARTLGELTNVSVIFEASREANKRRNNAAGVLKTRTADYEKLTENLEEYRSLRANQEALALAEQAAHAARDIQTRIYRLGQVLAAIEDVPEVAELPALPDLIQLKSLGAKVERLSALLIEIQQQHSAAVASKSRAEALQDEYTQLQQQYKDTLRAAGQCPTCGQTTEHIHA